MGYYIEVDALHGKAQLILAQWPGRSVTADEAYAALMARKGAIICVVDNGPFEAAAHCYNVSEFDAFNRSDDHRPKTWLVIDDTDAVFDYTKAPRGHYAEAAKS